MQQPETKNIIISGGGTGGHIFPAIAIAESLRKKLDDVNIMFIGAKGKMEMEKVPAYGYPIEGLWISGIQRRLTLKNLSFPFKLISSMMKAKRIIKKFKPQMVIGTGGYASGPTLKVATGMKIPALIQEQNSYPGITNKMLAKYAEKICVAYEHMDRFFPKEKIVLTGNPVRKDLQNLTAKSEESLKFFNIDKKDTIVLVIGGSQGALAINQALLQDVDKIEKMGIKLIWQTGKYFYETARSEVESKKLKNIQVHEFINRMDLAYSAADVVVSRAGAIAISELCLAGKPVIFVPLPTAAEDHQTKNAQALVSEKAALMVKNKDAKEHLSDTISKLVSEKSLQENLKKNIKAFAHHDASDKIADIIIDILNKKI